MAKPRKPSLKKITEHFKDAKEVFCLRMKMPVNISAVKNFVYNEADHTFTTTGGAVVVWQSGLFAAITKKKCNPADCNECKNCKEKRKNQ